MSSELPSHLEALIRRLYADFNARSIDAVIDTLSEDVVWANGMDGGHVHGRDGVRAYWNEQFRQIQSSVTPLRTELTADERVRVEVHQVVRDPDGMELLAETTVVHLFRFNAQDQIVRFDIEQEIGDSDDR